VIDAKQPSEHLKKCLTDAQCCSVMTDNSMEEFFTPFVHSKAAGAGGDPLNENDIGIQCDVVIIGSGPGGGVVAAVLAQKGYKVVVLDKGEYYAPDDISTLEGPSMISLYEKFGALTTEDGALSLAAAKTVGGGSCVNWSVCFKTPEHVRNEWVREFGLQLFASEAYEQAMEVVWKRLSVQEVTNKHSLQNSVLQKGCKKLGFHIGALARNASPDHYCGWCSYGCPTGDKQSTPETWLLDAVKTSNTLILSNCKAERILHCPNLTGKKPSKAQGVMASIGDGKATARLFIKANATVVACGSLMTPPLLLNSGLENCNIGKHLRLHPAQSVWGIFPEDSEDFPEGTCYEGGIMTAYSQVSRRNSSNYGALLETSCFHPAIFAAFVPWCSGKDAKERMLHYSRTVHICVVTRDKGSGRVGVDRNQHPTFEYSLLAYDEDSMMTGVDQALRVLVAAGATEIGTHQFDGERFKVQGKKGLENLNPWSRICKSMIANYMHHCVQL
jgi:long-chain-alcohol oxidase